MRKITTVILFFAYVVSVSAQQNLTPEMLLQLARINAFGITKDGKSVAYSVRTYNVENNKKTTNSYIIPITGGASVITENAADLIANNRISPDGKMSLSAYDVKLKKIFGKDIYPDLSKSDVMVYDNLNYRHWDNWEDGAYSHIFVNRLSGNAIADSIDIMPNEPYDCPQKPFGGDEDFIWSPDSKQVIYVTKKKFGKEYAQSTNTDIYSYDILTKRTTNLSEGMMYTEIQT